MGKMSCCTVLHSMIILLIMELVLCCYGENTTFGCIERERKALLKLRESFVDPSNRLSSWNTKDCCTWQGVACHKITGRVKRLDLVNVHPIDYDSWFYANGLSSKHLDSSLLELKHLSYLDLSWNNFQLSHIPAFLGSMMQLQYLNLSYANFSGVVPHQLGNLSSLHVLDLSARVDEEALRVDDLAWVSNLSSLEHLGMSWVNLSRTKDLFQVLNMLPSIVVLALSGSGLNNTHLPHACVNSSLLPNIQHLDLSRNSFVGEFPCFLQNMTSLKVLDISGNMYSSNGTNYLLRLGNLVNLDLHGNLLHHEIEWISDLLSDKCHLKSLELSSNEFYGEISGLFRNLSRCWINRKLERLDLSSNKFYGRLPEELGELTQLNFLDLSYNAFSGPIPTSLGKLRALRVLSLFENKLSGEIPISLGQLSDLEEIDLSSSTLYEAHFVELSKLEYLSLDLINFNVGSDWVPPFQLKYLSLESSKIGGRFPQWIQTQKALVSLDISNCSISGTIPRWLHFINLTYLDLSNNNIEGPIPVSICEMKALLLLDLSNNNIEGPIPVSICEMKALLLLDLSNNNIEGPIPVSICEMKALEALDLSENHLSGTLPDCWGNLQRLQVLRLSSNGFSGFISNSIGGAYSLQWLNLNNNSFRGQLPTTLKNCTKLFYLDVGKNRLSGKLPGWIGKYLLDLGFLILGNNEFYGTIPFTFCQLSELQVMDLANNKLIGKIPRCFGNFSGRVKGYDEGVPGYSYNERLHQVMKGVELEYTTNAIFVTNLDLSSNYLDGEIPSELTKLIGLIGLNLSRNHLGGKIPEKIGDLKSLISLDLSSNSLFGTIPESLSNLSFLSSLNLSHNNLVGRIPTGNQLQTLDGPSIYDGNPGLCGAPLLKKCPDESKFSNSENQGASTHEGDKFEKIGFYGIVISGFAAGFWGIIGVMVFKKGWRQTYFQYIEAAIDKVLGL